MGNLCLGGQSESTEDLRHACQIQWDLRNHQRDLANQAYQNKEHDKCQEHKKKAQQHEAEGKRLTEQINQMEFKVHNEGRGLDEIDLHGLFVDYAVGKVKERVHICKRKGISKLKVITGKGLHSADNIAKIKPAIWKFVEQENLKAETSKENEGVIVITIQVNKGCGCTIM